MTHRGDLARRWARDGYLLVERFFAADEVAELDALVDRFVAGATSVSRSNDQLDLDPSHSRSAPRVRRIKNPDAQDPLFRAFARHPAVVELLGGLFGRGVRLEVGKVNLKLPGTDGAIAWHQDYAFSPLTNDDSAAVGIFIDDVTRDNGPLLVVPGSHRRPLRSHHRDGRFVGSVDADDPAVRDATVREVTGPAGSVSIHHCRTLHASGPNRSAAPRRIYFNQYHAADAWPYLGVTDLAWWRDRLLSGEETYAPRITMTDVTLPLPVDAYGSIFELQGSAAQDERQYRSERR